MKALSLNDMLIELAPRLKEQNLTSSVMKRIEKQQYIIFLSATDTKERAWVVSGRATTFEESWKRAQQKLRRTIFENKIKASWVKADLVTSIDTVTFPELIEEVSLMGANYFRKGISFDQSFKNAFLAQEVMANAFFQFKEKNHVEVSVNQINNYIKKYRKTTFRVDSNRLNNIHLFDTVSVFHDGYKIYAQSDGMLNKGSRFVEELDTTKILSIIHESAQSLVQKLDEKGQFQYIHYPILDGYGDAYNILQHANTVYAMLEAYQLNQDEGLRTAIEQSLDYLIEETMIIEKINGQECAFIVERRNENEIKLGANAFTLLALIKHVLVTGDERYVWAIEQITNGILHFQREDGSFVHVLDENANIKEQTRVVYYEGQAVYALISLYEVNQNERWLSAVKKSFNYFIENDYWKHGDPWLSLAAEKLFYLHPQLEYADFNLRASEYQLNRSFIQGTGAVTLLDFLISTYSLIAVLKQHNIHTDVLERFKIDNLKKSIQHRAKQQLEGYFWPEMAMYFKQAHKITNNFFVQSDDFRIRIDEIAGNIISYCRYYELCQAITEEVHADMVFKTDERIAWAEGESLLVAHRYARLSKWQEAATYLTDYREDDVECMDITYATQANYLIHNGQTTQAEQVLGKANILYPKSEAVLEGLLELYKHTHDYQSALVVAGDLVKLRSKEPKYYFELGRAYAQIGEKEKAKAAFKIGLIYEQDMSTEKMIERIQKGLSVQPGEISTSYTFLGGLNNLGALAHREEAAEYITKITRVDEDALREKLFYEEVRTQYESLQPITPALIGLKKIGEIQYLTLEKINSVEKSIELEDVIRTSNQIATVRYKDLYQQYPNPSYTHTLKRNAGTTVVRFFSEIHRKEQNQNLFKALETFVIENHLSKEVLSVISKLQGLIMGNELYRLMNPEEHYSLVHGDFLLPNLTVRAEDNVLQAIDWGAFLIGPSFLDIALLTSSVPIPFSEIQEKYLIGEGIHKGLTTIEQIFFAYAFIVCYFIRLNEKNTVSIVSNFIEPALENIEQNIEQLRESM